MTRPSEPHQGPGTLHAVESPGAASPPGPTPIGAGSRRGAAPSGGGSGSTVGAAHPSRAGTEAAADLAELAAAAGLHRIVMLAWRDLDDPEAGGSELHAHEIASRWAAAGLDVTLRTSAVPGQASSVRRAGYRAVRRSGRYGVFAAAPVEIASGRLGTPDGVVEIWNGMPFLSPVWSRSPRVVFLHHVHAEMWSMVLPPRLAAAGNLVESRIAPPLYRSTQIVTLSESSRREIVRLPGIRGGNVAVVPPGIDPRYRPGGHRAERPLVVAVGRLVPVKDFPRLIASLARVRAEVGDLEAVIVGEGSERPVLEDKIRALGAGDFVRLVGHVSSDELVDLYRRAWVLASTSVREGWGMTVTEAAACGTPAVATRIAGHEDAIEHGVTGFLASTNDDLDEALGKVLSDAVLRRRLGRAAAERAARFTWEATARGTLEVLAAEATRHPARRR